MSVSISEPVHDWTVDIGEWSFGLIEYELNHAPSTYILYGPNDIETDFSAYFFLAIAAASVTATFVLLWFVLTKLTPREKHAPG